MSAKWRALQRRHRYTYNAVIFPTHFIEALNQTPSTHFFSQLKHLTSLNSTYAQLSHAKNIASAFSNLLSSSNADENSISLATRFYLEILFLENSMPLHRTLVSVLAKAKNFQSLIGECFLQLCKAYGGENGKGKSFCVSRVALSMMSTPKLGYLVEFVEQCAVLVGLDVVSGLSSVVSETDEYSRASPLLMEQCQEALSCMYYLLQRFPSSFRDADGENTGVLEMVFVTILGILKSEAFSRDCLVAAGVSLCAALQACLSPEELGLFIMGGVFNQTSIVNSIIQLNYVAGKVPYNGDLIGEICCFSALSRLCFIRGILTAVTRAVLNAHYIVSNDFSDGISGSIDCSKLVKTILYDGILPELCNYCENPTDSHFNFHALTVMQICLQQIKTSLQSNVCEFSKDYEPISENMGTRILKIVWNNLEDPLSQTVKQVHLIFDLFLDIQASLHSVEGSEKIKLFLGGIASNLLRLGPRCKGRYVPLASLAKRLGAKTILDMNPDLLFETTNAYIDDDVCCAATTFLKCFLECLRDEYWNSDGIEDGYTKYRGLCLPSFLYGLASGVAKLRTNLNTYALPVLFDLDMDCIFPMLAFLNIRLGGDDSEIVYPELKHMDVLIGIEQQVAVVVSLLKVARVLGLFEGDMDWYENYSALADNPTLNMESSEFYSLVSIKGIKVKIPVKWLVVALTHVDESLRIDAAESLFINPKTASIPSSLELSLMKKVVPLNMRCCSTAFQMKWTSLFRKFFSRVRTALERQFKQRNWQPLESRDPSKALYMGAEKTVEDRAGDLFNFMRWLSCFLFFSCYPSAPYERKKMAMELILIMLSIWSMVPPLQENGDATSPEKSLYPYGKGFTLPDSTLLLVGSIIDSWDQLRESSFQILLHFPTPLPGIHCPDMVREVIIWAKKLVCSPRVRESDAGALTLRLIFRKYVLDLGWVVRPSCNTVSFLPKLELPNGGDRKFMPSSPALEYIRSLIDWLHLAVEEGEKDLSEACKNSFVHGVLLTLRYTFEELDWNSNVVLQSSTEMKFALDKLLELVMRVTSLALWVVSADAWYLPEDGEDDEDAFALGVPAETEPLALKPEDEVKNTKIVRDVRASEQIVMVGCWLAMKEVSLLLGTIIRKIPLPTSEASAMRIQDVEKPSVLSMASEAMLDLKQLQIIGNHFLEVILKMKHNGAIDKTRAGFTALCNRLLSSNDPRLCKLTESWMELLMERMVARGQTVNDLLRRSAGIPAAFSAFFLSEPEGTPKKLLPRALRWLIDVAKKSLANQTEAKSSDADLCNGVSTKSSEVHKLIPELDTNEMISKIRDEGVIPTVHAFNVLRATFNDTNLATDTSGFSSEVLIVAIRSFSSPYWEVRNSACLAYTALVRRMIGFLNIQKRESARRALTGLEFFHRYPLLHSFLLDELKVATDLLSSASSENLGANLKNVVHPSLCPMLILLSRLKPSAIASDTGDALDPFLFTPFIRRCSIQSNLRIRILASTALTGLVSNEKLPVVLLNIASQIPHLDDQIAATNSVGSLDMTSGSSPFPYNSIHGILLQLSALLDTNCRNLADFSKKDKILSDLIQILVSCSWLGRPRQCTCPILNSCFLQVLDNMLGIAKTCQGSKSIGAIFNILLELSSDCLDIENFSGRSYYDPNVAELRKQAVSSFLNCAWQTSKEVAEEDLLVPWKNNSSALYLLKISDMDVISSGFREKLLCSMADASYEVRIATLKWFLSFLQATYSGSQHSQLNCKTEKVFWESIDLQAMLMELLLVEKNKKCTYYILKILYTWNMLCFRLNGQQNREARYVGNMGIDSVFHFWDKLVSLYKVTGHAKTRQTLICCIGICVKRFAGLFLSYVCPGLEMNEVVEYRQSDARASLSNLYDCITYFVNLIDEHSDAAEPVSMRKAAAESMIASGLLDQIGYIGSAVSNSCLPRQNLYFQFNAKDAVNTYAHKVLDLWLVCIKLLEDEDVGLRRQLAQDVQKLLTSKNGRKNLPAGVIPSQVEKVIEMSFGHLSSIFGHWADYFDYLCHWVLSAANHANYVLSERDLVRRVFDKEIDNHHEEKLFICQICCYHLEKLPTSKTETADFCNTIQFRNFLCDWRRRFCQQLVTFVNDHVGKQGASDWVGGIGNHKDAFLPLYANLLAFYALSNCLSYGETENKESILSEVIELGEVIRPFFRNPQICNLYLLVVKSHEKMVGFTVHNLTATCLGDLCAWDCFDPYFLLR